MLLWERISKTMPKPNLIPKLNFSKKEKLYQPNLKPTHNHDLGKTMTRT